MSKKFLFGAMAMMVLGLTACSSEEPANNGGEAPASGDKYVAVRIHSVGTNGTRAVEDTHFDGFENGINNENSLSKEDVRFYFFDNDGNPFTMTQIGVNGEVSNTNMVKPYSISSGNSNGNGHGDDVVTGVLILGKAAEPYVGMKPAQMVCVANLPEAAYTDLADKSLEEMQGNTMVYTLPTNESISTDKFMMTSSTYYDSANSKEVFATSLSGLIKDNASDAQESPAHVYIERLAAKIRVNGLGVYPSKDVDNNVAEYPFSVVSDVKNNDGNVIGFETKIEKKKLNVVLLGWQVRNDYGRVRYIKQLGNVNNIPNFTWNDPTNHRSYWAYTTTTESALRHPEYNIYSDTEFGYTNYPTDGTDTEKGAQSYYCYPSSAWNNIPAIMDDTEKTKVRISALANRNSKCTAVVVKAVVKFTDEDGNATDAADIVLWGGSYYTLSDFKRVMAHAYTNEMRDGNIYTADQVAINETSDGKNNHKVFVNNDEFESVKTVQYWKNGLTSFYVNVQHAYAQEKAAVGETAGVDARPVFAIIRNHIYDMTFSGVVGLGVPGNDVVNPEKPTESYLAAHIDVLNWHVVKNNIVLE